jgi:predicted SAM-dependent methyltransferase
MPVERAQLASLKYRVLAARRYLIKPKATRNLAALLATEQPPWNVHVGAADVLLPGWVNTDVSYPTELWLDATSPWPFPAGTVEYVFSDNVIEHLTLAAGRLYLRQAFTAMQSGGTIRTVTPDAAGSVEAYLHEPERYLAVMRDDGQQAEYPVDILRTAFSLWGHHAGYVYDERALAAEHVAAGFVNVRRLPGGQSDDPVLNGIDRPQNADLAIEANKP